MAIYPPDLATPPAPQPAQPSVVVPRDVAALGYQQLQLRKRIALALLARQQRAYPRTVGEGLSAVGNSLGDVGTMQMLQQQQAEYDERLRKLAADREDTAPIPGGT